MTRMYHAVGNDYQDGEDIYSFGELEELGLEPAWKWEGEPFDTDLVAVTPDFAEAERIAATHGLSRILVIDWAVASELRPTDTNDEGYPSVYGCIPAEAIIETIRRT